MTVDQTLFRRSILDPELPVPEGLIDGRGRPAGRRFAVYRNNVVISLTEALESGFPVVAKLLGPRNFRAVMGEFLRTYPPKSPVMMHYGVDLPEFLASFPPLLHLGYLADVARLELTMRRVYHAADVAHTDVATMQSLPPEALMHVPITLLPSVEIMRSDWPVQGIWRFNVQNGPKPVSRPEDVLISRLDYDVRLFLLHPGGFRFVSALRSGKTIVQAHEETIAEVPDFGLANTLCQLTDAKAMRMLQAGETE